MLVLPVDGENSLLFESNTKAVTKHRPLAIAKHFLTDVSKLSDTGDIRLCHPSTGNVLHVDIDVNLTVLYLPVHAIQHFP